MPWKSSNISGGVLSIMVHVHLPRADPHKPRSMPNVLMRAFLFLCVHGLIINPVLHLPSQRPSNGLFSPMEVRTDHLPMCTDPLVPVRRAWSCTSKATPSRGSSVLDIIANVNQISSLRLSHVCIAPLTNLLIAQRPYTDPPYKVKATKRATYWVNTHKNWKVSAKGYPKHV